VKRTGFLILGVLLLTIDGALCRVFNTEWIRPDPVLILTVYLAFRARSLEGVACVFILGVAAESFAATPPGMMMSAYILIWLAARWLRRFSMPGQTGVQLGALFALSILSSLLMFVYLLAMDVAEGVLWINLKAMLPLAVLHVILAIPVWALARTIWPGGSRRSLEAA